MDDRPEPRGWRILDWCHGKLSVVVLTHHDLLRILKIRVAKRTHGKTGTMSLLVSMQERYLRVFLDKRYRGITYRVPGLA